MTAILANALPRDRCGRCRWVDAAPNWERAGSIFPMKATVDSVGRILIPKQLRDTLGLTPGTEVDISAYESGIAVLPGGRTARVVEEDGKAVGDSTTRITDEIMYALIDAGRK